jgi:hypothetical protein
VDDFKFGVPAGWYPDPLGLPQLRWWDAQAWTEHTSEARAPIVIQPATQLGFADDDLPSRREQRERERQGDGDTLQAAPTETGIIHDEVSAQPLLAMTLRELEPPLAETVDGAMPDPRRATTHANAAPAAASLLDLQEEEAPAREPKAALAHEDIMPSASTLNDLEEVEAPARVPKSAPSQEDFIPSAATLSFLEEDEAPSREPRVASHEDIMPSAASLSFLEESEAPVHVPKRTKTYTGAVWVISVMGLLQLLASIILIVSGLGHNVPLLLVVFLAPYLLVFGLAAFDRLVLHTWGHRHPASALWALLFQPGYLIARAIRTYRQTGKGLTPVIIWASSLVVVLGAVLALPGLVISLLPGVFSHEVEQTVSAQAVSLGTDLNVSCPAAPPLVVGETFSCTATSPDGIVNSIVVSLQRENGWVAWRVEDWANALTK